ncbi:MAG: hypothetical protein ACOYL8_01250 [Patescibacteria group bacterium]
MKTVIVVIDKVTMEPIPGKRIVLGFSWGMSKTVYTDDDGEAEIEHTSSAMAEVYINGTYVDKIQTPTRKKFYVKN